MADKDKTDPHFVSTPKAKTEFSDINDLKSLLDDLDAINLDKNLVMVDDKKILKLEKHSPEDALPKVLKDTTDSKSLPEENIRKNEGEELSSNVKKEVKKIHDEAPNTVYTNLTAAFDLFDSIIKE